MKIPTFWQRLISHPLGVLLIALPMTAAINLVRYSLGYEKSILFGAFTGFAAVLLTQFFLSRKTSKNMFDAVKDLMVHIGRLDRTILYSALAACLWMFTASPTEIYVKELAVAVNSVTFNVSLLLMFGWCAKSALFPSSTPFFDLSNTIARALFAWCGLHWCLGELGDELYRFAVADPQKAGLWFIACVVAISIGSFALAGRAKVTVAAVRGEGLINGAKNGGPRLQADVASLEPTYTSDQR